MILQCSSCEARFLVNDALIPQGGREVRCGKCKHSWHVDPSPIPLDIAPETAPIFATFEHALASATPDEAEMMAQSVSRPVRLPAVNKPAFRSGAFVWSTAALAALALIIAPLAFYPSLKNTAFGGIYHALGWNPSDGLAFADVEFARSPSDVSTRTKFTISGNIMNRAKQHRTIDAVRVMLKDTDGEVMWSRVYEVGKELKPGDIYPFQIDNVETAFAEKVKTVMMDVGNNFELMVR